MKTLFERYRVENCKVLGKTVVSEYGDTLRFDITDYQTHCGDEPFVMPIKHHAMHGDKSEIMVSPLYILFPAVWLTSDFREKELLKGCRKFVVSYTNVHYGERRMMPGRKFGQAAVMKLKLYSESRCEKLTYISIPFDICARDVDIFDNLATLFDSTSKISNKFDEKHECLMSNIIGESYARQQQVDELRNEVIRMLDGIRFSTGENFGYAMPSVNDFLAEQIATVAKQTEDLRLELNKFLDRSVAERIRWLLYGK